MASDDSMLPDLTRCPFCGRDVLTFGPERMMYGHRTSVPVFGALATPWCEGGGRSAIREEVYVDAPAGITLDCEPRGLT